MGAIKYAFGSVPQTPVGNVVDGSTTKHLHNHNDDQLSKVVASGDPLAVQETVRRQHRHARQHYGIIHTSLGRFGHDVPKETHDKITRERLIQHLQTVAGRIVHAEVNAHPEFYSGKTPAEIAVVVNMLHELTDPTVYVNKTDTEILSVLAPAFPELAAALYAKGEALMRDRIMHHMSLETMTTSADVARAHGEVLALNKKEQAIHQEIMRLVGVATMQPRSAPAVPYGPPQYTEADVVSALGT